MLHCPKLDDNDLVKADRTYKYEDLFSSGSRVEKSGLGFRKLNHDVALVPRNSSLICQRLIVFWIKEGKITK